MIKLWLVILSLLLSALMLGSSERAIDKIQEARIAETAREMVVDGNWIVPHYNAAVRLQKPPLTYWTTAVSYKLLGVSELAARVPSMLFALFSACLLFVWLRQALNLPSAINAVFVLTTSFLGMRYFRSAEADATLLFFITLACYSGYQLLHQDLSGQARKRFAILCMLALGLGFLSKGPAGVAIPLLTLLIDAVSRQKMATLKALLQPWAIALFLLCAFGWYAWILLNMPDLAQQFFTKQVDETFVTGTHQQPIYWYLAHAIEFFAPWSLLLIPAGVWCYQHRPLPPCVRFALIWLAVVFVLLTWTVNKQTQYALLFAPPLAILLGFYIEVASGKFYQLNRLVFGLLCVAIVAIIVIAARKHGVAAIASPYWLLLGVPFLIKSTLKLAQPNYPILIAAVLAAFGYLFTEQNLTKDVEKDDIKRLMQAAKTHAVLYQAKPGDGAVSFYAERPIQVIDGPALDLLLVHNKTVWLASKRAPHLEVSLHASIVAEQSVGKWTLWKITRAP